MPRSCSRAKSHGVCPAASVVLRLAPFSTSSRATSSWPCSHAKCRAVFLEVPSSASGGARARRSSWTTSTWPLPAASQMARLQAWGVTKQLARRRRSFNRSPQDAAARTATATSSSSSRPSATQTAALMRRSSPSSSGIPCEGKCSLGIRAKFRRSSPIPMRNSNWLVATCSGNNSCQKSWPRKRKRPGPNDPPRGNPRTSDTSAAPPLSDA
mmetsp:Transcript_98712/g.279098  ORF Transcript_98712/g.279098 Transcript_98712/m.279098 type:complete len:212 (+) Transcript_98712:185-820(+)